MKQSMKTIKGLKINTEPPQYEDGSVVLKGFRVPQGYILYIESKTGGTRTVQTGEFSGGQAKFAEVQAGQVQGWTLQQVTSTPQAEFDNPGQEDQPEIKSPQTENTNEYIPEPEWGTTDKIGNSAIVPADMFKKFQRLSTILSKYPDDRTLRVFMKGNPEWSDLISAYGKFYKEATKSPRMTSSNGAIGFLSNGPATPKLFKVVSGIVTDVLATGENYKLMTEMLALGKEKSVSEQKLADLYTTSAGTGWSLPPTLEGKRVTEYLKKTIEVIEKNTSGNPVDPDDDEDDGWYEDTEDKGGSEFLTNLLEQLPTKTRARVASEFFHFYNDVKSGSPSARSINMSEGGKLSMFENPDDFMTITGEQYQEQTAAMTKEEAEEIMSPVISNFFLKGKNGEYVSKEVILENLADQIETLPDNDKFLLQKQIYLPDMKDLDIEDISSILEAIKSTGYGYEKEISQDEFNSITKIEGREIVVDDFPRVIVEGMSYQQSRFEILAKMLSQTSYELTFTDMGPDYVAGDQPFADFASEIIKDYIDYMGGDSDVAQWLFTDYVLENNSVKNSESAVVMRMLEAEEHSQDFTQITPKALMPSHQTMNNAKNRLDKTRKTYQLVKSAHQTLFGAIYPEGTDVSRLYVVPSPSDAEISNFTLNLSNVSSFSSADKEYITSRFHAHHNTHGPGGKTPVYVTAPLKKEKVIMMPNFFADQSHWRKKPDGSRYMVIRQNIPNRNFEEMEVIVSGTDCITKSAELKPQNILTNKFDMIEAEVIII